MTKDKIRLILCGACFVLSVLLFAGTTFAYFSDTKQISNTMTAGNVTIELSEAAVKNENGHLVEDPDAPRIMGGQDATVHEYGKVYPGMTIYKDPTITNTGDEAAWVAAKIIVTDGGSNLNELIGYENFDGIDIKELLSGGLLDEGAHVGTWNGIDNVRYNENYAIVQKADAATGTYEFHVFILHTLAADESVMLFDTFALPPEWTSEDMQSLTELTIHIQAYAVQLFDMDDCYEAMTKAFATHFAFETENN